MKYTHFWGYKTKRGEVFIEIDNCLWNAGTLWQQNLPEPKFISPMIFFMFCLYTHTLVPYQQNWYLILCTQMLLCIVSFILKSHLIVQKYWSFWLFAVRFIFWHGIFFSPDILGEKNKSKKPKHWQW